MKTKLTLLVAYTLAVLTAGAFGFSARGEPVAVFFQPARNVPKLAAMGVTVFFGPEVENKTNLSLAQLDARSAEWVAVVGANNATCVLKNPTLPLPPHCVGLLLSVDEPNGKVNPSTGKVWTATDLQGEADRLRRTFPGKPIFLSLAGDKITDVKPEHRDYAEKVAYYREWAKLADVLTVNTYSKNRNVKYPLTWTGEAVKALTAFTEGKVPVWAWIDCNDQQLPSPKAPEVNRGPTPEEIRDQVTHALSQGAKGIGWFMTCDSGKYGWGTGSPDFATRGDSYWPLVDRNGNSLALQYETVSRVSKALAPSPSTLPTTAPSLPTADPLTLEVIKRLDYQNGKLLEFKQGLDDLSARLKAVEESVNRPRRFQEVPGE